MPIVTRLALALALVAPATAFAAGGQVKAQIRKVPLEDINTVLDEMRQGRIVGRVVLAI